MGRVSGLLASAALTAVMTVTATAAVADDSNDGSRTESEGSRSSDRPSTFVLNQGGAQMGWSLQERHKGGVRRAQAASADLALGRPGVEGIDVSDYQQGINWQVQWDHGIRFAYIKATEGDYYESPSFDQQYIGSYDVGMIRGAYHFGNPDVSSGGAQARYFVRNGGAWSADGQTLPGVLDIEADPYGTDDMCYGQSPSELVAWIDDFVRTYEQETGRAAVIYTNSNWWRTCTNNSAAFAGENPLWFARWASEAGSLPGGWPRYTFWQYTSTPVDHDVFNGSLNELRDFAT